ncbi:lactoylglutathione lyase [Spirosomataceae bacterium TFI 002]|nr:lactoylglutathione lyase [Spirosomataceae bacterium TFI 002]
MKIEHIAIWVKDLEEMRNFYIKYFGASSNERYHNPTKQFFSYFLSFPDGPCRLEIMSRPDITFDSKKNEKGGITHFAFSLGSASKVDKLTEELRKDGFNIVGEPRTTGDGYYESVIQDPEGNRIEICA